MCRLASDVSKLFIGSCTECNFPEELSTRAHAFARNLLINVPRGPAGGNNFFASTRVFLFIIVFFFYYYLFSFYFASSSAPDLLRIKTDLLRGARAYNVFIIIFITHVIIRNMCVCGWSRQSPSARGNRNNESDEHRRRGRRTALRLPPRLHDAQQGSIVAADGESAYGVTRSLEIVCARRHDDAAVSCRAPQPCPHGDASANERKSSFFLYLFSVRIPKAECIYRRVSCTVPPPPAPSRSSKDRALAVRGVETRGPAVKRFDVFFSETVFLPPSAETLERKLYRTV